MLSLLVWVSTWATLGGDRRRLVGRLGGVMGPPWSAQAQWGCHGPRLCVDAAGTPVPAGSSNESDATMRVRVLKSTQPQLGELLTLL